MIESLEDLTENFSLFSDWEERYRYLIDLGRKLPEFPDVLKTDANRVQGCTSRVWMVSGIENGAFHLRADSDAHIVRGLIALLLAAYDGISVDSARGIDIKAAFETIGLDRHLSPSRRNGFFAMEEKIREVLSRAV